MPILRLQYRRSPENATGRARSRVLVASQGGATVAELAARLGISAGAVSQHLARLRAARVITSTRVGKFIVSDVTTAGAALLKFFEE